jgi:hypothetical protein
MPKDSRKFTLSILKSMPIGLNPYSWAVNNKDPLPNPTSNQEPSDANGSTFSTIFDDTYLFCSIDTPTF